MSQYKYDVLLSHNSADKPAIEELAHRLRAAGLEPWLDKWNLVPGETWQPALEDALCDCATCAVFVGPSGFGAWQHEEMRAAIARRVTSQHKQEHFRVIPVLLPGAVRGDRSQLPEFLTATTWVEFRNALDDESVFRILERAIRGLPPGPGQSLTITDCPYRGLEFFDVKHAPLFFGREVVTDWLLSALRGTLSTMGPTRFLGIIGASGSGKSSLARAGLLAALRNGEIDESEHWLTTICRPGSNPLESLASAVAKTEGIHLGQGLTVNLIEELKEALQSRQNTLHLAARASFGDSHPMRRLVVLVDQFEELFTVCRDDSERQAFIGNLLYASRVSHGQTIILLTMRADFYGKCAGYTELSAAISEHQFLVGPLTAHELQQAIERPAQLAGCEFEPGLVELLVEEVQRQPGALPLLQYGLMRMWNARTGRRITITDYRAVGQLDGIIEKRAEEVFQRFTEPQQELCRRLFLRLTEPGEGTEDTKRSVHWHELISAAPEVDGISAIVKNLADERLLTTSGSSDTIVEVAHETLIRKWQRFRKWIDADREGLRIQRDLTKAATQWDKNDRDTGLLEHGTRLAIASEWAETHQAALSTVERDFLAASIQRKEEGIVATRRTARRFKILAQFLAATSMLFVVATATTIVLYLRLQTFSLRISAKADKAERDLRALNHLSNAGLAIQERRVSDSLHWYAEALRTSPNNNEVSASSRNLLGSWSARLTCTIPHDDRVGAVAFSLDMKTILTGSSGKVARLWDAHTGRPAGSAMVHKADVSAVALSPDGRRALTVSGNTVQLWNTQTGEPIGPGLPHEATVSVAYHLKGTSFFTGSGKKVIQWDISETGIATLRRSFEHTERVSDLVVSPDGEHLLTGSFGDREIGEARLWKLTTEEPTFEVLGARSLTSVVGFSSDNQTVAVGRANGSLEIWSLRPQLSMVRSKMFGRPKAVAFSRDNSAVFVGIGDVVQRWDMVEDQIGDEMHHDGEVSSMAISADGSTLLTGCGHQYWQRDGSAHLWNLKLDEFGGDPIPLEEKWDGAASVFFSPDLRKVFMGNNDAHCKMWSLESGKPFFSMRRPNMITGSSFRNDGEIVATGAGMPMSSLGQTKFGEICFWRTETGVESAKAIKLRFGSDPITSLAYRPDGRALVVGGPHQPAQQLDLETGKLIGQPMPHRQSVSAVAYSPDGNIIITGSPDQTARLWDAKTGKVFGAQLSHESTVTAVAFGPDNLIVVTGSEDGLAKLWDVRTSQLRGAPLKHSGRISTISFSPDGQTVLIGAREKKGGEVRLWDLQTLQPRGMPFRHAKDVLTVAFSSDGESVLTGSSDATVRRWVVPPPASDELSRIQLSVEVRTGTRFDEDSGSMKRLSQMEWLERQERLWKEYEGPCDVRTWAEVSAMEKKQVPSPPKK